MNLTCDDVHCPDHCTCDSCRNDREARIRAQLTDAEKERDYAEGNAASVGKTLREVEKELAEVTAQRDERQAVIDELLARESDADDEAAWDAHCKRHQRKEDALRAEVDRLKALAETSKADADLAWERRPSDHEIAEMRAEVERLTKERDEWKKAAGEVARSHMDSEGRCDRLKAENERLRAQASTEKRMRKDADDQATTLREALSALFDSVDNLPHYTGCHESDGQCDPECSTGKAFRALRQNAAQASFRIESVTINEAPTDYRAETIEACNRGLQTSTLTTAEEANDDE